MVSGVTELELDGIPSPGSGIVQSEEDDGSDGPSVELPGPLVSGVQSSFTVFPSGVVFDVLQ